MPVMLLKGGKDSDEARAGKGGGIIYVPIYQMVQWRNLNRKRMMIYVWGAHGV